MLAQIFVAITNIAGAANIILNREGEGKLGSPRMPGSGDVSHVTRLSGSMSTEKRGTWGTSPNRNPFFATGSD
jgi:hypothetical protein